MPQLLWLIPVLPLAGFIILALAGKVLSTRAIATIGVGSVGLSALASLVAAGRFLSSPPPSHTWLLHLWTWIPATGFQASLGLAFDPLSLVMTVVVTVVSFLIHLYSVEYMAGDEGYSRFFAWMNLFVAAMVTLVLADNLVLLLMGWEGVGLCSYLLIGFWYRDPVNGRAAQKAFIVTRAGDVAFTVGLLLLFTHLGSLNIQELVRRATTQWPLGSPLAVAAGLLLLGGAVGKSAQLPLQVWLPDAMAGPTPTSALIHAATMVTAGVYLIARMHGLYALAPSVEHVVAIIGALTLILAGCSAIVQDDIKRILAYSTISQIGYMFLALGVGAWSAAIFHFMTHAFFKALLFLAAGVVIHALHNEQNILRMGGLRQELPLAFWGFFIGGSALAGLPLITSGFFSKDLIVWASVASQQGSVALWWAGVIGGFLTALYIFRLIFLVFFGQRGRTVTHRFGLATRIPVISLCVLSIIGGWINLPPVLGDHPWLVDYLSSTLPAPRLQSGYSSETLTEVVMTAAFLLGLLVAWWLFPRIEVVLEATSAHGAEGAVRRYWASGWGFDWLYERIFVRPVRAVARAGAPDYLNAAFTGLAALLQQFYRGLSHTQTGRVRWYAAGLAAGTVILLAIALWS